MAFHEAGIPLSHGKHTIAYCCCCFTGIKTQHRALTTKPSSDNENKTAFPYHTVGARFAPPHKTPTNISVRTASLTHPPSTDPNQLSQITYTCPFTPCAICRRPVVRLPLFMHGAARIPPPPFPLTLSKLCAVIARIPLCSPELNNLVQLALFPPSPKPRQNCAPTSYHRYLSLKQTIQLALKTVLSCIGSHGRT